MSKILQRQSITTKAAPHIRRLSFHKLGKELRFRFSSNIKFRLNKARILYYSDGGWAFLQGQRRASSDRPCDMSEMGYLSPRMALLFLCIFWAGDIRVDVLSGQRIFLGRTSKPLYPSLKGGFPCYRTKFASVICLSRAAPWSYRLWIYRLALESKRLSDLWESYRAALRIGNFWYEMVAR